VIAAFLPIIGNIAGRVVDSVFPDPADKLKAQELQQKIQSEILRHAADIEKAAAENIRTEAASSHWLAANWRPLTMLTFVALIVARWLGFSADGMTESEYVAIYDLIKIGLSGYVIGRSAEKIAPGIIEAWKK
jgi:hypothetical protein